MSATGPLRILLVGAGTRGRVWARVVAESAAAHLVGIVDSDRGRAEAAWAETETEGPDGSAVIGSELEPVAQRARPDAVVVATPPDSHHALVSRALDRGLHVLCEKPLSEDMDQVVDLVERADRTGLRLWVGMNFRYLPSSQRIRQYVGSGALGALSHGQFSYLRHRDGRRSDLNDYPMTMAYPLLLEQSVHHFDLIRYCYRSEVEALVADSWRPSWSAYEGDCCASVLFRLSNGAHVSYLGTWTAASNEMAFSWRSDFEGGTLTQRAQFDDLVRVDFDPDLGRTGPRFKTADQAEPQVVEKLARCTPFVDDTSELLTEFVRDVREGLDDGTTARDHLRTLCLVQACIRSIEDGRWVRLDDVHEALGVSDLVLRKHPEG